MSNTRTFKSPGVFGNNATTTIPGSPIPGVSYRNLATSLATVQDGWKYGTPVDSAAFNQIMFQITSLLSVMDSQGVLGWSNLVDYPAGAVQRGSDGRIYDALIASGPSTTVQDPTATTGAWSAQGGTVGEVAFFALNTAPTGWLNCNGLAVSRTTYARLFAAIGTTYGVGNGTTTFNLPELRGEFLRSWDNGRGIDAGRALGSTQASAVGPHTHNVPIPIYNEGGTGFVASGSGAVESTVNITSAANSGVDTVPRNVALLTCIKY